MMTRGTYCQALEELPEELLRGPLVAPALDQDIEHVVVLIDGAPQVMTLPVDRQKHLVQVPFVAWLGAPTLQLIGVVLPKLQTPLPDGFMRDVDPACKEQLLYIAVTQREAVGEPNPMAMISPGNGDFL